MSIVEFLSQPFWQRLGLTLVHFLWQGLAVAVLVGAFVRVFRLKHGNVRYGAYLLAFIAMIACPVVTFTAIDITISPNTELVTGAESIKVIDSSPYVALPEGYILPEAATPRPAIPTLEDSIPLGQRISDWLNVSMPWVLLIWMVGVVFLSVRLLMGFVGVYRWRHHLEPLPERLAQCIVSLSEGLGMRGFSWVFISPTVLQAMAVGYLRPMVLLPAAMVTQMQPEMLEAVIAHELAHIRRFDLWINLAQRVTETLLFYHPAVWWLSNCIRRERELCCDELAVKATGRRLTYATTLESVGRAGFMAKKPVLAAGLGQDKKPTLGRVRHILGLDNKRKDSRFWLAGVIAVLLIMALVIPTGLALTARSEDKSDVQGKSQHIDVETLLNKVRQAQRPTENMIVEWQYESPQPVFAAPPISRKQDFSPPSRILKTYKAIIAGDKSRIEERELTFQSQKDTEPSRIREITYVFDGTMQKQLDHFVKGFENEYRGYRHTYDKNIQLLLKLLLAYPPFLDTPKLQEKYNLKVIENKEKGLIILETSKENSGIHRFTIDPDKDYNIVKQDVILPRGKDYEINCIVKKQANGLWYQVAREQIRYSAKTGKPFLESKVKITKLDFNPEIPTGAFELQFPKGIKIWDGSLKDWIIVGDEEETSREPAVQVDNKILATTPKNEGTLHREIPNIKLITNDPAGAQRTKAKSLKPEIVKTSDGRAKLMYLARHVYCRDLAKLVAEKIGFITDKNITCDEGKNQISIVCPTTGDAETVVKFLQEVDVEPIQVQIDVHVVEAYSDVELDWETREAVRNITRTKTASNAKPEKSLSAPDILRETAKTEPQAENSVEKLIDLLASGGYLKILMNPTIEVINGKTARIMSSSSSAKDEIEITPHVFDDQSVQLETRVVFTEKTVSGSNKLKPIVNKREIRNNENRIKIGESLVIGGVTKTEKRAVARDRIKGSEERTTEVLVILTPTIITPEMNLSKKPDVQVEAGKEALTAEKLVLKLVDNSGRPVAGAKVGTSVRTRDEQVLNSKLYWSLSSKEKDISDEDGKIVLTQDKLFPESWNPDRRRALYILNEERQIGAFCEISKDNERNQIELTLEPVCHVHGKLGSEDLEEIGRPLKWSNVYLGFNKDSHGVLSCMSEKQKFDFWVPPGEYELSAYGSGDGASTKHVRPMIEVKTGQSELDLGVVDLPATKLSTLIGKSAPEIGPIRAWKNGSPVKLSELRGKAVILHFGGGYPSTSRDLPKLVELHEDFHDAGLVIIAIYNCESMEQLEQRFRNNSEKFGGVPDVPFRLAVDGGQGRPIEGTDRTIPGATYAAYEISVYTTTVLINSKGKIVEKLNIHDAKEKLGNMLGVEVKTTVSAWRQRFEEVYRLEDNRILKRIAPPFIPERRDYYVNEHSDQCSAISTSPGIFVFHWNGKLKNWGLSFTDKFGLNFILSFVLRLKSFEYDGPEELLNIELPGDWIIRDEVSQKVKLKALEELLAEELDRYIQFEKRIVEREVIVATGRFRFHPLPAADNPNRVYMFSDKFEPNAGGGGGTAQSVAEFLGALGNRVGVPVIDETEASKEMMIGYDHHHSAYLSKLTNIEEKAQKLEKLLANLTKQTELQFRIQKRPVEVWFITEKKKDK